MTHIRDSLCSPSPAERSEGILGERDMASVLDRHDVASPLQKALSGTLNGLPLYGEEWIAKWKARAAAYPEALREKMVAHYLKFFPIWGMEERFFSRDAVLWFHQ